ncbi:hypothetical protein [Streptomyces coffeae]|uniref:Uncharacterized protein n=1 Tax=Streptomyces coffeae TaxID=621382 RepID=A0ABS1NMH8_9ACTN|nr:hypothetical protein [Streptomyces coffeae]MBL1101107.1 hypothetical protein [Streptomyces coffeae]
MTHAENDRKQLQDAAEEGRRARFGALPERVRPEEMVEERPATAPDPARNTYNDEEWLVRNAL